ncbi:hypothetical protein J1614_007816 [Plenodomus biglobosus]|nr:hypothetical protein J1614_007816 [Plenodomus biglobosus]
MEAGKVSSSTLLKFLRDNTEFHRSVQRERDDMRDTVNTSLERGYIAEQMISPSIELRCMEECLEVLP